MVGSSDATRKNENGLKKNALDRRSSKGCTGDRKKEDQKVAVTSQPEGP